MVNSHNQTQQVFTIDVDKFLDEIATIPGNMSMPYTYPPNVSATGNTQQDIQIAMNNVAYTLVRAMDEKIRMAFYNYNLDVMAALRNARVSNTESLCGLCRPMPGESPCQF